MLHPHSQGLSNGLAFGFVLLAHALLLTLKCGEWCALLPYLPWTMVVVSSGGSHLQLLEMLPGIQTNGPSIRFGASHPLHRCLSDPSQTGLGPWLWQIFGPALPTLLMCVTPL